MNWKFREYFWFLTNFGKFKKFLEKLDNYYKDFVSFNKYY